MSGIVALPNLRSLSIGEILDRAVRLYRRNFAKMIGICAVARVPVAIINIMALFYLSSTYLLEQLENFFIQLLIQGALMAAFSRLYFDQPVSIKAAYRTAARRYGSLLGAAFLQGLAVGIPVIMFACGLIEVANLVGQSIVWFFLLLVILVPFIAFLLTHWMVTSPGIIVEDIGAQAGLKRSWDLIKGSFWRVLGLFLATTLLVYVIEAISGIALFYVARAWVGTGRLPSVITIIGTELTTILVLPLSVGVITLLYYDLRVRREGLDLEMQLEPEPIQEVELH